MLQCLPTETVYEVACWFDKRLKGECRAPEAWKILRLVFLKNQWLPCDRIVERVLQRVFNGSGGFATRGEGVD